MFGKKHKYAPFDKQACERIEASIAKAETRTSGEIHVHVAERCAEDVVGSAIVAFEELGLAKTRLRNGVLFFFATRDRKFAVIGDKGINDIVGQGVWDDVVDLIKSGFASRAPIDSICEAIGLCGSKLAEFFPPQEGDEDELPNQVSFSHGAHE